MSGRADSDHPRPPRDLRTEEAAEGAGHPEDAEDPRDGDDARDGGDAEHAEQGDGVEGEAGRARWTAAGAGGVLAVAGVAAALLRNTGSAPALVPAAYACGAAVCGLAAVLGARGRTRRALWLLIGGLLVMALGDQFD
ncbi:hypothetical protein ACIF9R_10040 [Streptomyces sp. NPDC086080]|uniref:hypothetical protein n=1 Tax=Streptomyces sp. NPDC086080 TaxID=3365748 RepID=UPI0037D38982